MLADDHRILRSGLKSLLTTDPNIVVVGEATNGDEAIQIAQELSPDIILLDISMPGTDSVAVIRRIKQIQPDTRVLILTMHEDSALLQEFIRAGAAGYIIKRAAESELIDAIYAVWRGIIYIHPSMMHSLVNPSPKPNPQTPLEQEQLTSREVEILRFIVRGHTNRQIASALNISVRTASAEYHPLPVRKPGD